MAMAEVHFVGAGSGAPDLITVRGRRLLEEADVVIYAGSLVNRELLSYTRPQCELHDSAYLHLDQVIEIMRSAVSRERKSFGSIPEIPRFTARSENRWIVWLSLESRMMSVRASAAFKVRRRVSVRNTHFPECLRLSF